MAGFVLGIPQGPAHDDGPRALRPGDAIAFDVVVPSLSGFVFSHEPGQRRLDRAGMARVLVLLMRDVLGYAHFGIQGGDLGAHIATRMAEQEPKRVTGLHLNFLGFLRSLPRPTHPSRAAPRRSGSLSRARRMAVPGVGLSMDPGNETPDAGVRIDGFTHRAGGLDGGEVLQLDGPRRMTGCRPLDGRSTDGHHAVLGHADRERLVLAVPNCTAMCWRRRPGVSNHH
ncbi:alpha/beta fold hydrolase [Hydrogenophaga palleronii]|uniref:alpha/beta fold hydrolase n=1 Tax=Hydrogenophaga palleronii TaxID=65655 RepID=UPI0012EECA98